MNVGSGNEATGIHKSDFSVQCNIAIRIYLPFPLLVFLLAQWQVDAVSNLASGQVIDPVSTTAKN